MLPSPEQPMTPGALYLKRARMNIADFLQKAAETGSLMSVEDATILGKRGNIIQST